jgi:hypothetical protein
LKQQGASLRSLEVRCEEMSCPGFLKPDLLLLKNRAKEITHLSINVRRNGIWPLESLGIIATLPNLRSADLWFNIQSRCAQERPDRYARDYDDSERGFGKEYCKGEDQFQRPLVNREGAEEVFAYMLQKNGTEQGVLEQVTLWVGDLSRAWDGPMYDPAWVEERRSKVVCSVEEKGEEEKEEHEGRCIVEEGDKYWEEGKGRYEEWELKESDDW